MNVFQRSQRFPRLSVAGLTAGAWLAVCFAAPADPEPKPASPPAAADSHRPIGVAGCAAANCHGRPDAPSLVGDPPPDCWRSSATHWRAVDPHTTAYALLHRPLAKKMIEQLRKGDPTFKDAADEVRCLACHTNPALAPEQPVVFPGSDVARLRAEGIGCEGCHGNAEAWQFPHTGWTAPGKRPADFARYGMVPLGDHGDRAAACAGCHVGAGKDDARGYPARDMNHDMIAAGHPRLNFDYRAYSRLLRPHWYEPPAAVGAAAREWLIGRVAAAEALARLHAARGPGVELSEFNCFACHHDLTPGDWRGKAADYYKGRVKPGALAWQLPWPLGTAAVLTGAERAAVTKFAREAWKEQPKPAIDALAAARARLTRGGPIPPAEFLAKVRVDAAELARLDWDQACGLYYALRAAEADLTTAGKDPGAATEFEELARKLALPGHTTPGGKRSDSPTQYTPGEVSGLFREVQEKLRKAAGL